MEEEQDRFNQDKNRLRELAEEILSGNPEDMENISASNIQELIHQLQVHKIELEMQNEELRKAQLEIEKSRNRYLDLYDFAPVGSLTLDRQGIIQEINHPGADLLGMKRAHLIKASFSRFLDRKSQDKFHSYRKVLLNSNSRESCEVRIFKNDKTPCHLQLEGTSKFDSDGNFDHFKVAMLDITKQKQAEEELRKSRDQFEQKVKERTSELRKANEALRGEILERKQAEERSRLVVESAPNAFVMVNQSGEIIFINSQTEKMFGYDRKELIGLSIDNLVPERFRKNHARYRLEFYPDPEARQMGAGRDLFALHKDGTEFPVEIGLNPVRTAEGIFILAAIVDITERKLVELELNKEREKAQTYLDLAQVMILKLNEKGEITLINEKGCELLECKEEVIGKNWFENFIPSYVREEVRSVHNKLINKEIKKVEFFENPVKTSSGQERIISWHNTTLSDEYGNIVGTLSSGVDITEHKQAEQMLRTSEERLKAIMNNTTDAILVYEENGHVITFNKEASIMFCEEGDEIQSIWDIISPENKTDFSTLLKEVKGGRKLLDYETEKVNSDGEVVPVSIALVYVNDGVGRYIETIRNIRERVALRSKIVELEKSQVVKKMAEGIAHHMGTPLASMLLRVQMLKEDLSGTPFFETFVEKLESIEKQIFYGQRVMQRLLRFSYKPESEKRLERISTLLEESADMIRPLCRKSGIEIDLNLETDINVLADVNLLELVFSDIMMNAIDAMPDGGAISVTATDIGSEQMVDIRIADTGKGISEKVIPLIFDPFFTTKAAGKGTGLGLSVAKRIVIDHGGKIGAESREGEGTTIWIKLPINSEEKEIAGT